MPYWVVKGMSSVAEPAVAPSLSPSGVARHLLAHTDNLITLGSTGDDEPAASRIPSLAKRTVWQVGEASGTMAKHAEAECGDRYLDGTRP